MRKFFLVFMIIVSIKADSIPGSEEIDTDTQEAKRRLEKYTKQERESDELLKIANGIGKIKEYYRKNSKDKDLEFLNNYFLELKHHKSEQNICYLLLKDEMLKTRVQVSILDINSKYKNINLDYNAFMNHFKSLRDSSNCSLNNGTYNDKYILYSNEKIKIKEFPLNGSKNVEFGKNRRGVPYISLPEVYKIDKVNYRLKDSKGTEWLSIKVKYRGIKRDGFITKDKAYKVITIY